MSDISVKNVSNIRGKSRILGSSWTFHSSYYLCNLCADFFSSLLYIQRDCTTYTVHRLGLKMRTFVVVFVISYNRSCVRYVFVKKVSTRRGVSNPTARPNCKPTPIDPKHWLYAPILLEFCRVSNSRALTVVLYEPVNCLL